MKLDEKRKVVEVLLCAVNSIEGGTVEHYTPLGCAAIGLGHDFCNPCDPGDVASTAAHAVAQANNGFAWGCAVDVAVVALEAAYRLIESSPTLRAEWFGER